MDLSDSQVEEVEKLLKYIEQLEGIVRTSPSQEQITRVRKQIYQYGERLRRFVPDVNPQRINISAIRNQLNLDERKAASTSQVAEVGGGEHDVLSRYPTQLASPHSQDHDINFLATAIRIIQLEYWPVISEQHCKLDFSHATERDSLRAQFESAHRSLSVLAETIEEYALADKQDFREQLSKMKNKQSRVFLYEVNDILKKCSEFLKKLNNDVETNGNIIMNKGNRLKFNPRFEEATVLEGCLLEDSIKEFAIYLKQVIKKLNLPVIKTN